MVQNTF